MVQKEVELGGCGMYNKKLPFSLFYEINMYEVVEVVGKLKYRVL